MRNTIITCDHCGGENTKLETVNTERRMTMTQYMREFVTYSALAYYPTQYRIVCADCGHVVEFQK